MDDEYYWDDPVDEYVESSSTRRKVPTAILLIIAYSGNSLTDWYLPDTVELNLLCQWTVEQSLDPTTACNGGTVNSAIYGGQGAGIMASRYVASSEYSASNGWTHNFNFAGGQSGAYTKSYA